MKTLILDSSLKSIPFPAQKIKNAAKTISEFKFISPIPQFNIFNPKLIMPINGFFDSLAKAWENHLSITITPTDIWYVIICEIAEQIKNNPTKYSNLFTTTPNEKKLILVPTFSVDTINPQLLIDALRFKVPTNIDIFLPKFTTNTLSSDLSMNVAFCDLVSPYYNYGTFLCGIPAITIAGTQEDWDLIITNLNKLILLIPSFSAYLERCKSIISEMLNELDINNLNFFKKIVRLTPCGSGHQFHMNGWILSFLFEKQEKIRLEKLPTHTSSFEWVNIDTERKFKMFSGMLYATISNGSISPSYNSYSIELFH